MYTRTTIATKTRVVTMKKSFFLQFWICSFPTPFTKDFSFGCLVEIVTSETVSTYEIGNSKIYYPILKFVIINEFL